MDDVKERVARAICRAAGYEPDDEVRWLIPGTGYEEGEPYAQWTEYLAQAEAAIAAVKEG